MPHQTWTTMKVNAPFLSVMLLISGIPYGWIYAPIVGADIVQLWSSLAIAFIIMVMLFCKEETD